MNDFSVSSPVVFEVPKQDIQIQEAQQHNNTELTYSPKNLIMLGGLITNEIKDYTFTKKSILRIAYIHFSIRSAPNNNCQTRLQLTKGGQDRDILWYNHQQGASATEQYENYNLIFPIPLPFEVAAGDYLRFRCDGGSDGNYSLAIFVENI